MTQLDIVMVDLDDGTMHTPRSIMAKDIAQWGALITSCGITLDNATVGARRVVEERAARYCPECFDR